MKAVIIIFLVLNAVLALASPQSPDSKSIGKSAIIADGIYQTRYEGRPSMSYVSGYWENAQSVLGSPSKWTYGFPIVFAPELEQGQVCLNPGACVNVGLTTSFSAELQNIRTSVLENFEFRCGVTNRNISGGQLDLPFVDSSGNLSDSKCQGLAQLVHDTTTGGVLELVIQNAQITKYRFIPR
jgi:hypothetical protein